MWNKVNSMLTDFDKKSNLIINDIDPTLIDKYNQGNTKIQTNNLFNEK